MMSIESVMQRVLGGFTGRSKPGAEALAGLCRTLLSQRGEASGVALARDVAALWQGLTPAARAAFFELLDRDFAPDAQAVLAAASAYREAPDAERLRALQRAAEPPRQELFRRINMAPNGTATLVALRAELLERMRERPQLAAVDADLMHLFSSWFNRGFLSLVRIDWRTPAVMLEKLIAYEAVHEIKGWSDLRRRLAADRRCFAFVHPALPDEPLIFLEVALCRGMADTIAPLVDPSAPVADPAAADTAIFYSINNCHAGLKGVSFGNFLIKQVAAELAAEFPRLRTFATLSPIPGFRKWLEAEGPAELAREIEKDGWHTGSARRERLKGALSAACAVYLTRARRDGYPADPVARFHLGNGASLERLNWLADVSPKGLRQSAGMMANYLYRLAAVERNHELYANHRRVVASRAVEQLAASATASAARAPVNRSERTPAA